MTLCSETCVHDTRCVHLVCMTHEHMCSHLLLSHLLLFAATQSKTTQSQTAYSFAFTQSHTAYSSSMDMRQDHVKMSQDHVSMSQDHVLALRCNASLPPLDLVAARVGERGGGM